MQKLLLFLLLFSDFASAQVVPIGIIKGKRLPSVNTVNEPNYNNSNATLYGSIKLNVSKLTIKENGFVVLNNSNISTPTIDNARKIIVAGGILDFSITIDDFSSNTAYKYRAYATNSNNETAYSNLMTFTTSTNYCEVNPCKNGASCTSLSSGPICLCTIDFCGDCCAQQASDLACPGGSENLCPQVITNTAASILTIKNNYYNTIIKSTSDNNIWKSTQNIFSK